MSHEIGSKFYYSGIILDQGVRHPIRIEITRGVRGYSAYCSGMEDRWHIPRFASSVAPNKTLDGLLRSLNPKIKEIRETIEI